MIFNSHSRYFILSSYFLSLLFLCLVLCFCFFHFSKLKYNYIISTTLSPLPTVPHNYSLLSFKFLTSFCSLGWLKLPIWTKLVLNSETSACLCLWSVSIKGMYWHAYLSLLCNHLRKRKESSPQPCQSWFEKVVLRAHPIV